MLGRNGLRIRVIVMVLCLSASAHAQAGSQARPRITGPVEENHFVILSGNQRPEATAENDRGPVADSTPMEHMLLQLRRAPEQEQALVELIDQLHTPGSPNFHRWLTAQQFGEQFGLAKEDLATITGWLRSHGFTINQVYPNGVLISRALPARCNRRSTRRFTSLKSMA